MLQLALALLRLNAAEALRTAGYRAAVALGLVLVAALAVVAALGCLIAAAWIALLPALGPIWTPVLIAAVFALVALAALLAARGRRRPAASSLQGLAGDPAALLSGLSRDHKLTLILGAVLIGLVAGIGLGRRR